MQDSMRLCAAAGYQVMDFNFYDCTTFRLPFVQMNWESWIWEIHALQKKLGLEFSQGHSHFFNFCDDRLSERDYHEKMVYRSVDCAAILHIPWLVIHAGTAFDSPRLVSDSAKKNMEALKPIVAYAAEKGVGIAIENLWDLNISPKRRYTTTAEELVELVDAFESEHVGICWDFEHADMMQQNQSAALWLIGNRLKATHVSEQAGIHFDHLLPFSTNTDWHTLLPILNEIGYHGDLTYEIHRYTAHIPDALVPVALEYSVLAGKYLLSLANRKV